MTRPRQQALHSVTGLFDRFANLMVVELGHNSWYMASPIKDTEAPVSTSILLWRQYSYLSTCTGGEWPGLCCTVRIGCRTSSKSVLDSSLI